MSAKGIIALAERKLARIKSRAINEPPINESVAEIG